MDRDDHALALTNETAAPKCLDTSLLTDRAREWMQHVKWACLNLQADLKRGLKKRKAAELWSRMLLEQRQFHLSAERLRKLFDAWLKQRGADLAAGIAEGVAGDKALINERLCGRPAKRNIPAAVIARFWSLYLDMKDKASVQAAWRTLMRKFCDGEAIAKGITWQTIFMREHPADDLPAHCPWSLHRPPPGWSMSNFSQLPKPDDVTRALALRGIGAAKAVLAKTAGVNIAWDSLRVGECYFIDDHDLDFRCIVGGQIVRLRLIVLREARTRRTLAYVARPRLKEEDGTQRSITRRDVQHLLAGWLYHFGIPRDFECYLHCENAAAAVSEDFEQLLLRVSAGRLRIDRTAVYRGVVQNAGFTQSGGTPTGKAMIESSFRLLDLELAHIRGATGRNYLHKPEDHEHRLGHTRRLLDRINSLTLTDREEVATLMQTGDLKLPFPSIWEAHHELSLAIQRMDARTWHECEGFITVHEFRTSPDSSLYYPLNKELLPLLDKKALCMVREFFDYPETLQNRMLGEWGRKRAESPAECWMRLMPTIKWARISDAGLFELMLDSIPHEYKGQGTVKVEIAGQKIEFRGPIDVQPGTKIKLRTNFDNPFAAWAQDEAGRVVGTLERVERIAYHDAETMRERAEFKAVQLARATQSIRVLEAHDPDAVQRMSDNAFAEHLLTTLEGDKPTHSATISSPLSDRLLGAVAAKPDTADAEIDAIAAAMD